MPADVIAIASGVVGILRPFMPYLVDLGESAKKKLEEVIQERGGEKAWELAQNVWARINGRYGADRRVQNSAEGVALEPDDERAQEKMGEVLAQRLQTDAELAAELQKLVDRPERAIRLTAGDEAVIQRVRQRLQGTGTIDLTAGNKAHLSDIDQEITH